MNQPAYSKVGFERDDTKAVKGIAILLMLFHHFAAFPDRTPVGFEGFASLWPAFVSGGYLQAFAISAKICVSLYFFLGGYGLYIRWKSSKFSVTGSILDLYKAYWRVFLVFIPICLLFFARSGDDISVLCTKYAIDNKFSLLTIVLSGFIGWSSYFNEEWWFLKSYICAIPLGYLFCCGTKKNRNFWLDLFIVFGIDIFIRDVFPSVASLESFSSLGTNFYYVSFLRGNDFVSAFFAGIVFAKYDAISAAKQKLLNLPCSTWSCLLGLGILYWCRTFVFDAKADILFCGLMIPMVCVFFDRFTRIKRIFMYLGKHSTNMWLIHSFYCYYFLEVTQLVYCTRNVWIDFGILVILTLASSIALNGFYKLLGQCFGRIHTR